jgi:hypothetical protein
MRDAWPNNFGKGFLLGGLAAVLLGLLMGAVHNDGPTLTVPVLNTHEDSAVPLYNTGRYQVATWESGGGYGAFVLDTSTGTAKVAYSSIKGPNGKIVNNLGKPFHEM